VDEAGVEVGVFEMVGAAGRVVLEAAGGCAERERKVKEARKVLTAFMC
jgi:hypothetical protein